MFQCQTELELCQDEQHTGRCRLRSSDIDMCQHTVRRSLVCCCGDTNMKQSANPIARLQTITRTIQAVIKDTSLQAYIRLLTAAAPSDSVFRALGTN